MKVKCKFCGGIAETYKMVTGIYGIRCSCGAIVSFQGREETASDAARAYEGRTGSGIVFGKNVTPLFPQ